MDVVRLSPGSHASQAVIYDQVVYISGQQPSDNRQNISGQTRQVLAAIDAILQQVGSHKSRIVNAQVYLADIIDFDAMNEVWAAWVDPVNVPARTTVEARLVNPAVKIEIAITAATPEGLWRHQPDTSY